jgi:hypothetical protein
MRSPLIGQLMVRDTSRSMLWPHSEVTLRVLLQNRELITTRAILPNFI